MIYSLGALFIKIKRNRQTLNFTPKGLFA